MAGAKKNEGGPTMAVRPGQRKKQAGAKDWAEGKKRKKRLG